MSASQPKDAARQGEEEEEDEQQMDVSFIKGFADKVQRLPTDLLDDTDVARPKISIPKRGEKDFEPLNETVNLQEMMLQSSRQALFEALQGVRGVASKSLSHAVVTPSSPFPQLLVSRGHVLDTLGMTIRRETEGGNPKSRTELLPEEALYLIERGSLQLWNGRDPRNEEEIASGVGLWSDEEFGVKGAVELSVVEAFGAFMGKEGLTWQRYQAYAYLKRLGYTVQRTRRFIPEHFLANQAAIPAIGILQRFSNFLRSISRGLRSFVHRLHASVEQNAHRLIRRLPISRLPFLPFFSYGSILASLRFVPAGHRCAVPEAPKQVDNGSIYQPLEANPYLPFFHVWKPVTAWSKTKWDRGSAAGLAAQPPHYSLAVVESRETPLPSLSQLEEVFDGLPDEMQGPTRRVGPQYQKPRPTKPSPSPQASSNILPSWLRFGASSTPKAGNAMGALRNGDRGLIVAVNDSGNTGWVRFGRTGFEAFPMV